MCTHSALVLVLLTAPSHPQDEGDKSVEIRRSEPPRDVADGLAVLVVDGASGEVQPGALVRYADVRLLDLYFFRYGEFGWCNWERELCQRGATEWTDKEGIAYLERFAPLVLVSAECGERAGMTIVDSSSADPVRVRIDEPFRCRIRVIDREATPAGEIPVAVGLADRNGALSPDQILWRGVTEASGGMVEAHLFFPRFGDFVYRSPFTEEFRRAPTRLAAILDFPLAKRRIAPLEAARAGMPGATLSLPPTGSIEAQVSGWESARLPANSWLVLRDVTVEEGAAERKRNRWWTRMRLTERSARWPFVGLGLQLRCTLEVPNDEWKPCHSPLQSGPRHAGEVVSVDLELPGRAPFYHGRAVDLGGVPLRRAILLTKVPGDTRDMDIRIETDAQGRFRIHVEEDWCVPPSATIYFRLPGLRRVDSTVQIEAPWPPAADGTELGDVVLDRAPLIAAGTVRDEEGRPLPGVCVRAYLVNRPEDRRRWADFRDFRAARIHPGRADLQGRYEVRSWIEGERWLLEASEEGYCDEFRIGVSAGTRGLDLSMRRAASLFGSVILDEAIVSSRVEVLLELELEPSRMAELPKSCWKREARVDVSGRFKFEGLPPRRAVLSVFFKERLVFRLDDLVIPAGERLEDPRLQGIDFLRPFERLRLRLLGEDGIPLSRKNLYLQALGIDPPEEHRYQGRTDTEGRAEVIVAPASREFFLDVAGARPVRLAMSKEVQDIRLQPALMVVVDLPPSITLPEGVELSARLVPTAETEVRWRLDLLSLSRRYSSTAVTGKEVELEAPASGAYTVEWRLAVPIDGGNTRYSRIRPSPDPPFEIRDTTGVQRLFATLRQEVVDELIAQLRK